MFNKILEKSFGAMFVVITVTLYSAVGAYLRVTGEFRCLLKGCADRVGSIEADIPTLNSSVAK